MDIYEEVSKVAVTAMAQEAFVHGIHWDDRHRHFEEIRMAHTLRAMDEIQTRKRTIEAQCSAALSNPTVIPND